MILRSRSDATTSMVDRTNRNKITLKFSEHFMQYINQKNYWKQLTPRTCFIFIEQTTIELGLKLLPATVKARFKLLQKYQNFILTETMPQK
jgi:hypothetical protein